METTEDSDLPMDCEGQVADSPERRKDFSTDDKQVCMLTDISDSLVESTLPLETLPSDTTEFDQSESTESSVCTKMPCHDEREALMLEAGHVVLDRNVCNTSSVSNTLSSAESVSEDNTPPLVPQEGPVPNPKQHPDPEKYPVSEHELEPDRYLEAKGDVELWYHTEPVKDNEPDQYPESEQNHEVELYPKTEFGLVANEPNPEDDDYQHLPTDTQTNPEVHDILFEHPISEDSLSEQLMRADVMSAESSHYLDPDEMDEYLTVEIAEASSGSETDEKWRVIFSSSINKEDDDSYVDSLHLSAQELFVQKVEVSDCDEQHSNFEDVCSEVPHEVLEQPEEIMSCATPSEEVKYTHLSLQGLSKLSENGSLSEREANRGHIVHKQHINAAPNKKIPKDFCVIQETKSKNVSTEHVDFQLARKQWRELEKQTLNKMSLPKTKPSSLHDSHRVMNTSVQNIERSQNKECDLETLNMIENYSHNQFSHLPVDGVSNRSPHGYSKIPNEWKTSNLSMEGGDMIRQTDLSMMGKSTDCVSSQGIPRSISTPLTPSFIITSSPTKEPQKHEMLANNVIILDPSNELNSSPRHGEDNMVARSIEWHSEDNSSNIIILETSNLIIRSASEFSLSKVCEQPQEKVFLNNPFFKLRSRSTVSLVDEEIKMVRQREEELKKERVNLYGKDIFNKERLLPIHMDTLAFENSVKCKSSPSSPLKTASKMDRSAVSCDVRFPEVFTGGIRKSAMALRWEAGEFSKSD